VIVAVTMELDILEVGPRVDDAALLFMHTVVDCEKK